MSEPGPDESHQEFPSIGTAPSQLPPPPTCDNFCAKCSDGFYLPQALRKLALNPDQCHRDCHIANVGCDYRGRQGADCALCSILLSSRVVPLESEIVQGDEIRLEKYAHSSGLISFPIPEHFQTDTVFLAIGSGDTAGPGRWNNYERLQNTIQSKGAAVLLRDGAQPAMFAPQEVPARFDADRASGWLRYCKNNHERLCGRSTHSRDVTGLCLIDCTARIITDAQINSPYVALSYVWGESSNIDNKTEDSCVGDRCELPQTLSSVITDAITVTQALGFRYLWVDALCINQDDADTKHDQIKQMNDIYENAELTIVAAAGVDATYGLPGVGQRARTPQNIVKLGGVRIISTMKDPHLAIRSSRWASRGWTFQEAVLSRRRLVFTNEQMYFECNAMNCWESIYSPLDKLHAKDKSRFGDEVRGGMFGRSTTHNFGTLVPDEMKLTEVFNQYASAIQDYSSRELTYDSDSLNAFRGIIERYSKHRHHIYAIWGLPYSAEFGRRWSYFALALAWSHAQSGWGSSNPPKRREEFPSWTWAGWAGAVQIPGAPLDLPVGVQWLKSLDELYNRLESVRFGRGDHAKHLKSLRKTSTALESKCRVLQLLAKALPPTLFVCETAEDGKMSWTFGGFHAELIPSRDHLLEAQLARGIEDVRRWRCIWICSLITKSYAMVLELDHKTDHWTRAGLFQVRCVDDDMARELKSVDAEWFNIE